MVQGLLRELRDADQVRVQGQRRWARWFPVGAGRDDAGSKSADRSKPGA